MRKSLLALAAATSLAGSAAGVAQAQPLASAGLIFGVDTPADRPALDPVQFFWAGRNYCWYDRGWHGPGWYWCGYPWRRGYGWGGPYGWHGWRGGERYGWRGGHYYRRDGGWRDGGHERGGWRDRGHDGREGDRDHR